MESADFQDINLDKPANGRYAPIKTMLSGKDPFTLEDAQCEANACQVCPPDFVGLQKLH